MVNDERSGDDGDLGDFIGHGSEIHLVLAEAVDEIAEEEEEDGHGGAVDDGAQGSGEHEEAVEAVGEGEELVEGEGLLLLLLLGFG